MIQWIALFISAWVISPVHAFQVGGEEGGFPQSCRVSAIMNDLFSSRQPFCSATLVARDQILLADHCRASFPKSGDVSRFEVECGYQGEGIVFP